jgi:CoA:oxalate CoA-transferase
MHYQVKSTISPQEGIDEQSPCETEGFPKAIDHNPIFSASKQESVMLINKDHQGLNALEGIRILDFSQIIAGPTCTRFFADLGAEVIKVERPPQGDSSRNLPALKDGVSGLFLQYNAGKKGLCLDLKNPESIRIIKKLVEQCDVVVENFKVGTMDRMGLSYDILKEINPFLIMCSISGYGQTGPNKDLPSLAGTIHAAAGVTDILSRGHGEEVAPAPHNLSLADTIAGYHAFSAVVTALFHRERTGKGQAIDISLFDSLFCTIDYQVEHYLMTGTEPPPTWGAPPIKAKDGYITIGMGKIELVLKLIKRMGMEKDERFDTMENLIANADQIIKTIEEWVFSFDSAAMAEAAIKEIGIPVSKVCTPVEAANSSQVRARSLLKEIDHPKIGKVDVINSPLKFSEVRSELRRLPPELGEHNREILTDLLGYSDEEIETLVTGGVLFSNP